MNGRQFIPLVSAAAMALALSTPFALAADAEDTSAGVKEARPVYPTSMESMIERRRDQLERRREHYRDARTGRRWYQSPWGNAQDDWMDRTEDVMNERFRNRRDLMKVQSDARGRGSNPRSKWRRTVQTLALKELFMLPLQIPGGHVVHDQITENIV